MLQIAGYCAFEYPEGHVAFERTFSDNTNDHFRYAWHSLSAQDQRLLALLPVVQQHSADGVIRLEHAALVRRTDLGATIDSAAFAAFVARQSLDGLVQVPPITLDMRDRIVLVNRTPLSLTPSEFNLLARFIEEPGRLLTHTQLEACLDDDGMHDANTAERLKTTLRSLRQLVGQTLIQNERGIGYRFVPA
jgi:DNA-binding response OmpR family regulator